MWHVKVLAQVLRRMIYACSVELKVLDMLQVPIDIAFWGRARLGAWFAGFNLAADLLLMADVALHFFRAYISHNSVVVTRLAQIRRHYLGAHPCLPLAVCQSTAFACVRVCFMHSCFVKSCGALHDQARAQNATGVLLRGRPRANHNTPE